MKGVKWYNLIAPRHAACAHFALFVMYYHLHLHCSTVILQQFGSTLTESYSCWHQNKMFHKPGQMRMLCLKILASFPGKRDAFLGQTEGQAHTPSQSRHLAVMTSRCCYPSQLQRQAKRSGSIGFSENDQGSHAVKSVPDMCWRQNEPTQISLTKVSYISSYWFKK